MQTVAVTEPQRPLIRAVTGAFQRPHPSMRQVVREPIAAARAKPKPVTQNSQPVPQSMGSILRRETQGNWLMPYLAAMTPTYIESLLRGGLAGNHVQMHQLFDLMWDSDPEIQACCGEYIDGVLDKKFVFTPYAEEDEEPTPSALEKCKVVRAALTGMRPDPMSAENNLYNTVKDILAARFFGTSVLEIDWYRTYGDGKLNLRTVPGLSDQIAAPRATYWVNPTCYAWTKEEGRLMLAAPVGSIRGITDDIRKAKNNPSPFSTWYSRVVPNAMTSQLTPFPANKFLIACNNGKTGSPLATSVFRSLAFWWCASNFCADYMLKCAELFGVPFRKATYNSSIQDWQKQEIKQMLQSCGSTGWALLPEGVNLEFEKAVNAGSATPQAFLYNLADSQKRKVILHQTMTGGGHDSMGKGGGKAFGDVEATKTDTCINAGARFATDIINEQFVPAVLDLNFPLETAQEEAPMVTMVDDNVGGLVDAQKFQALATIMDVPESHLRRTFRIPKAGAGDTIAGVDSGIQGAAAKAQENARQDQMQQQQDQAQMQADAMAQQQDVEAKNMASREALEAGSADAGAGCLMAMIPEDKVKQFTRFAVRNIEDGTEAGDGIEDEPHVTVIYGFKPVFDVSKLTNVFAAVGPVTFTIGKVSRLECADYDVIKFEIESPQLVKLHDAIAKKFADDITPGEHDYNPHLTVATVAKGTNQDIDGGKLVGQKFTVDKLIYSLPNSQGRQSITTKTS